MVFSLVAFARSDCALNKVKPWYVLCSLRNYCGHLPLLIWERRVLRRFVIYKQILLQINKSKNKITFV